MHFIRHGLTVSIAAFALAFGCKATVTTGTGEAAAPTASSVAATPPPPPADTDGDGIPDDKDACPNEPENFNDYLDQDGCPDSKPTNVKVTKDKIEISQKIYFETAKTIIKPVSYGILNEVAQVLKDYPNLSIRVEGHTDSDGNDAYNMTLSQGRAETVMTYLTQQGIQANRLPAQGFGESRPIDTNKTSEGKANNRRVEFMITGGM